MTVTTAENCSVACYIAAEPHIGTRHAYLVMDADEIPGWRFTIRLDDIDGARVVTEFRMTASQVDTTIAVDTVKPRQPGELTVVSSSTLGFECSGTLPEHGLTTTVFRRVTLGRLVNQAVAAIPSEISTRPWLDWLSADRTRPGPTGRDDLYYAQWAAAYVQYVTAGEPRPVPRLAKEKYLSVSQVRSILGEARKRSLLTNAPPGRPGGHLTELADSILEDDSNVAKED